MLITSGGVLIRTKVNQVRETGRAAQGVRLINLDEGENLVSLTRVAESEEDCESEEGMDDNTDIQVDGTESAGEDHPAADDNGAAE